jgi:hypothetical protein
VRTCVRFQKAGLADVQARASQTGDAGAVYDEGRRRAAGTWFA